MQRPVIVLSLFGVAVAQQRPVERQDYCKLETVSETAISPDGRQVGSARLPITGIRDRKTARALIGSSP
jgi:hypothetical protein